MASYELPLCIKDKVYCPTLYKKGREPQLQLHDNKMDAGEPDVEWHLYEVQFYNPNTKTLHPWRMVLAASMEDALSQAECEHPGMEGWNLSKEDQEIITNMSEGKQVPFLIRGWGKHLF